MISVNNIERLRKQAGWSRPLLAEKMNTSYQQIEKLEKGHRRLAQEWIDRAATAFGVTPAEIITEQAPEPPQSQIRLDTMDMAPDRALSRDASQGEIVQIIQLDLSLPMGPGATIDEYAEEQRLDFDLAYVRSFTRTPPNCLRLARGIGESMYPTLNNMDLVWIDSTQRQLNQSDRVWAVSISGAAAIKRLRPLKAGRVFIISDNPAIDNYEVDADELIIGGRIIRFARNL